MHKNRVAQGIGAQETWGTSHNQPVGFEQLAHPAYSPKLVINDFHLLRDDDDLKVAVRHWFEIKSQNFFNVWIAALRANGSNALELGETVLKNSGVFVFLKYTLYLYVCFSTKFWNVQVAFMLFLKYIFITQDVVWIMWIHSCTRDWISDRCKHSKVITFVKFI